MQKNLVRMHYVKRFVAERLNCVCIALDELDILDALSLGKVPRLVKVVGQDVNTNNMTLRDESGEAKGRPWAATNVENSICGLDVRLEVGTAFVNGAGGQDASKFVIHSRLFGLILRARGFRGAMLNGETPNVSRGARAI
jgi:hypothetical protein